ncbi:MAG: endonuclease III [Candidatus Improbicoccus pseudotrichonymphae]|uniref:Endonuclease III n=1 Tax=Candidatus Improbicoccus pseudotrichonymphae TaxID=3033792 RepID=A0AA48IAH4_9FIRM|nr:MAG: endonuclease III [Candidatus Improbicoccus pseudotrichonymphae]
MSIRQKFKHRRALVKSVLAVLLQKYPNVTCGLSFKNSFELLISARLSARCTDKCVNKVAATLFERFMSPEDFVSAELSDIEDIIKPCGMYKTKAKNIKDICIKLVNDFNSNIPSEFEDLLNLPGIGRKTANLITSEVFGIPRIVTDTHVCRVTYRIGLHCETRPVKIEKVLSEIVSKEFRSFFCHAIIALGREFCKARTFRCTVCPLVEICLKQD